MKGILAHVYGILQLPRKKYFNGLILGIIFVRVVCCLVGISVS